MCTTILLCLASSSLCISCRVSQRSWPHSTYISSVATAEEVEAALEGLEPTGDLTVTRSVNTNGYDWQVKRKLYVKLFGA